MRYGAVSLVLIMLFLVPLNLLTAGDIRGSVKGNDNLIAGATVRMLELGREGRTDGEGRFEFRDVPAGTYRLYVRVIGYAPAIDTVRLGNDTVEIAFVLRESAIPMEEIVVSASPYARPADEQYQSAESKSMVELHQSGGSSFADKIADLPGVTVRSNGSAPARPVLRGLSDNRVLILENGLRTGDISAYDPAHAVPIEAASITHIDVVRGPAGIMYGPSTIGGLVNVLTNTIPPASTERISGTVSLSGNTVSDEYAGYVNAVYSRGGHAFGLSGGGLHSQDTRIPEREYVDPASGHSFDLSRLPQSFNHTSEAGAGYSLQGDFGMIGIGGRHYEMNYGIPGVPPNPDWMQVPPTTSRIAQRVNDLEMQGLMAVGGAIVSQLRLNANVVDYNHSEYPTAQDSAGVGDFLATHFHKQACNAMLQAQHGQLGRWQGTLGVWTDVERLSIDGDEPLGPNSLTTGVAGYLFEEYLLDEGTRFQAGIRFDYNRIRTKPDPASTDSVFRTLDVARISNALTASVGAIHKIDGDLTLSVNLARSFRAPTVQELFADGLDAPSGTYTIGNAELSPEAGFGIDASLKGGFTDLRLELSPFANFVSDYIYGFLTGDTLLNFPVRKFAATDARLLGFEASITAQPVGKVAVTLSVDYVNAQDTRNDVPLPFTPPLRGLLRTRYQAENHWALIEWRLAADQNRLGDGDTPTPGYGIVNVGAGIRVPGAGVVHNIGLRCDNLFDRVYRDHLSVIKDFVPQPGRGIQLTYDLVF